MLVSSFNLFIHMAIEFKFIVFKKKKIRLSIFGIDIITSPAFEAVWRSSVTIRTTENTNFQRQLMLVCLFVCLVFFVPFQNFSHRDVTITGQGLQILTYARHLWSLNSEGSLACHTYCDMGHPFKMANALTHCTSAVASKTMKTLSTSCTCIGIIHSDCKQDEQLFYLLAHVRLQILQKNPKTFSLLIRL